MDQHNMKACRILLVFIGCLLAWSARAQAGIEYFDLDTACRIADQHSAVRLKKVDGNIAATYSRAYCNLLLKIRSDLAQQSDIFPKFLVSSTDDVNAFSYFKNGQAVIGFTTPLLNRLGDDRDAIAAIVGHEIAHLKLNHSASKSTANVVFELLGALAGAALDIKLGKGGSSLYGIGLELGGLGSGLAQAAYSREAEREADALGVRWMMSSGYDAEGAIRVHRNVIQAGYSFLSTHPSSDDRLEGIYKVVASVRTTNSRPTQVSMRSTATPLALQSGKNQDSFVHDGPRPEGQVGVIVGIKERHQYIIVSGTTQSELYTGDWLDIVTKDGRRIPTMISRSIDGYYSAMVPVGIRELSLGDRVDMRAGSGL
ncbi:MAG: M48 family metallopeptidase [Thiobacillus sp.]